MIPEEEDEEEDEEELTAPAAGKASDEEDEDGLDAGAVARLLGVASWPVGAIEVAGGACDLRAFDIVLSTSQRDVTKTVVYPSDSLGLGSTYIICVYLCATSTSTSSAFLLNILKSKMASVWETTSINLWNHWDPENLRP